MVLTRLPDAAWRRRAGLRAILAALGADEDLVRFVGGAVRDSLLDHAVQDIDLATTLEPPAVIDRLEAAAIKAIPTGIDHGTVTAVSSGTVVEVTTLRCDVSTDGRRATVAYTDRWQEDAARRDFTINALYAHPTTGEVEDYFGGLNDLAVGHVRFIGDPLTRIAEDHLRILRFFRFHARFGRGEPDGPALEACTRRANDLMALSRERIADELLKLLALPDPTPTVRVMIERGILTPVLPEIASPDRLEALIAAEAAAGEPPEALRRLAALIPPDPALAEDIAARLRLSNAQRKRLAVAADPDLSGGPRALAYRLGRNGAVDRLLLAGLGIDSLHGWSIPRLPISGGQIIAMGVPPGPEVARTVRAIEQAWVAAGFPEGEEFDAIVARTIPRTVASPGGGS